MKEKKKKKKNKDLVVSFNDLI